MEHLFISLVVVKWNDRDPVVYLEGKAVDAVVYYNNVRHVSITKDSQIFYVIALLG